MQFIKPIPFQEALDKLDSRTITTSGLDSEAWSRVPVALRDRAFFSARVESARFLQRGRDGIADWLSGATEPVGTGSTPSQTILKSGSRASFVKQMQDFAISEGMGPLEPQDAGTIKDITSEKRLALIFDVQTRQSSDFGYWQQGNDPAVFNAFPAQRFIREKQVKEPRSMHQHHEGEVHLKSDLRFWIALNQDFHVPWGPWGWGCGHGVEDVSRAEAETLGLLQPGQKVTPPEKDLNDHLQASVKELDPDIQNALREQFGNQVEFKDGAAQWTGHPLTPTPPAAAPLNPVNPEILSPPAPASQLPLSQLSTPLKSPVSRALEIIRPRPQSLEETKALIDLVHDDGALPVINVVGMAESASANGFYDSSAPIIGIKPKPGEQFTFLHETGHFLDHQALGVPGQLASRDHPDLAPWRSAVENTALVQRLKQRLAKAHGEEERAIRYLLRPWELWARSYAQWMVNQSVDAQLGSSQLRADLLKALALRQSDRLGSHWVAADFDAVSDAIDNLFQKKGWL